MDMSDSALSLQRVTLEPQAGPSSQHVVVNRPLDRILAFTGFSIDDVIDNPIARQTVYGYFKVHKQILRVSEVIDLERQWNPHQVARS
jgi:hypothetical protein